VNTDLIRKALELGLANTLSVKTAWPDLSDIYQDEADTITAALAEIASRARWRKTLVRLSPCVVVAVYAGMLICFSPAYMAVLPIALVAIIAVWKIMKEGGAE
jgi:hypothetical protein